MLSRLCGFPSVRTPYGQKNRTGWKGEACSPRLGSSDCLLRGLDKAYNPASRPESCNTSQNCIGRAWNPECRRHKRLSGPDSSGLETASLALGLSVNPLAHTSGPGSAAQTACRQALPSFQKPGRRSHDEPEGKVTDPTRDPGVAARETVYETWLEAVEN